MYSPTDYGILATFSSILAVLAILTCLRYEFVIMLPRDDKEAANIAFLALLILVGWTLLTVLAVVVIFTFGIHLGKYDVLRGSLFLIPPGVLLMGFYRVLMYWSLREKDFSAISRTRITQGIGQAAVQLSLGELKIGHLGLLIGQIVGQGSGNFTFFRKVPNKRELMRQIDFRIVRESFLKYWRFPLIAGPAALLNTIGLQIVPVLFVAFYGTQPVGYLSLAQRLFAVPLNLIGSAVGQVYISELAGSSCKARHEVRHLFLKLTKRLCFIGGCPIVFLGVGCSWLVPLVFGHAWNEAAVFMRVLSISCAAQFVVSPLSQSLNFMERQDWQLLWDVIRLVTVSGAILLAHCLRWTAIGALALYSFSMTMNYAFLFVLGLLSINRAGSELDR